jgi:hypothetical protein
MLQDLIDDPECVDILATDADKRGLTPLFWEHVLPYGEVKLNMASRLTLGGAEPPAIPPAIPLGLSAGALTAPRRKRGP